MSQSLPAKPSLAHLKKQAKDLLTAYKSGQPNALDRFQVYFPTGDVRTLAAAQLVLAREYGFRSWAALKRHVESFERSTIDSFLVAAIEGNASTAVNLWSEHSSLLEQHIGAAAMMGKLDVVQRLLAEDPSLLNKDIAPSNAPVLCYLASSKLIRQPELESQILLTCEHLLKQGADPDSFAWAEWGGEKFRETALYDAAGIVNHPGLTRLLLDAGADPNDHAIDEAGVYRGEAIYHACEHASNECLRLLLEANPHPAAVNACIFRKLDFEDIEGLHLFLEHGAVLNGLAGHSVLRHAVLRGRSNEILKMLLDAGADPNQPDAGGTTPYALARRLANHAASELMERYGARQEFSPFDAILIASAEGDENRISHLCQLHPEVGDEIRSYGQNYVGGSPYKGLSVMFCDLVRLGHVRGVKAMLDLGMTAKLFNQWNETPLHWACIAGRAEVVPLLVANGADFTIRDTNYRAKPIDWAVWGSLNWNDPAGDYAETVRVMLELGSPFPNNLDGAPRVQDMLRAHGMSAPTNS